MLCMIFLWAPVTAFAAAGDVTINAANFPDDAFRSYVSSSSIDKNTNGILSATEINYTTSLYVYGKNISNLKGIEYFTNLTSLNCGKNQLTSLDVSKNTKLLTLQCYSNQLTSLDLSKNLELETLNCYSNTNLTNLNITKNTKLDYLEVYSTPNLTSLDISKNTKLDYLKCSSTGITKLDLSNNTALTRLYCYSNNLTSLDVSKNVNLKELQCNSTNLTSLILGSKPQLRSLNCDYNSLTTLDVSKCPKLTYLQCNNNDLTSLSLQSNTNLLYIECQSNNLTNLNVKNAPYLYYLNCAYNSLSDLDVRKNTHLKNLYLYNNDVSALDLSYNTELTNLQCAENNLSSLNVSKNIMLESLQCYNNPMTYIDLSKNIFLTSGTCSCNGRLEIGLAADGTYDLSQIPGLDIKKISELNGATLSGKILTDCDYYINYAYNCGNDITAHYYLTVTHTHEGNLVKGKAATCTEPGRKSYYKCTECGSCFEDKNCSKEIKQNINMWKLIPIKKHVMDKGTVYRATPASDGYIVKNCTLCEYKTSETIYCPKTITLSTDAYTYNGKTKTPTVSVKDSTGKLVAASNYDVAYSKGRKNVGVYTVTITFKGARYEGDTDKTFKINPVTSSIKKLTAGRKSFKISWKKVSKKMKTARINGYQIQYSTSPEFKRAKIKKITGYSATSKKITKLKAKKNYYVRVRTYIKVDKQTFYSGWSKVKTVKTK